MAFQPLYDHIVVRRTDDRTVVEGGVIVGDSLIVQPESYKEQLPQGEVLSTGQGRLLPDGTIIPLIVKAGDKVLFGKYAGTEQRINGEDLLIMREEEVLGTL